MQHQFFHDKRFSKTSISERFLSNLEIRWWFYACMGFLKIMTKVSDIKHLFKSFDVLSCLTFVSKRPMRNFGCVKPAAETVVRGRRIDEREGEAGPEGTRTGSRSAIPRSGIGARGKGGRPPRTTYAADSGYVAVCRLLARRLRRRLEWSRKLFRDSLP